MRCELPQFKRCCLCLPLRYGLISWGYLKLIMDALIIVKSTYELSDMIYNLNNKDDKFRGVYISDIVTSSILIFVFATDFVLTTVFVIGGHMKSVKLLKVFYYYSQVMWAILFLLMALCLGFNIYTLSHFMDSWIRGFTLFIVNLFSCITFIGIQFYLLLLIRSEIMKLENNCDYRFMNNATDAESTLTPKDDVTGHYVYGAKGIEIVTKDRVNGDMTTAIDYQNKL